MSLSVSLCHCSYYSILVIGNNKGGGTTFSLNSSTCIFNAQEGGTLLFMTILLNADNERVGGSSKKITILKYCSISLRTTPNREPGG